MREGRGLGQLQGEAAVSIPPTLSGLAPCLQSLAAG